MHDGIAHECRLGRARLRQDERAAIEMRLQGHCECATNRTQLAGQCELAGEFDYDSDGHSTQSARLGEGLPHTNARELRELPSVPETF
jgi:hypothetical protein